MVRPLTWTKRTRRYRSYDLTGSQGNSWRRLRGLHFRALFALSSGQGVAVKRDGSGEPEPHVRAELVRQDILAETATMRIRLDVTGCWACVLHAVKRLYGPQ